VSCSICSRLDLTMVLFSPLMIIVIYPHFFFSHVVHFFSLLLPFLDKSRTELKITPVSFCRSRRWSVVPPRRVMEDGENRRTQVQVPNYLSKPNYSTRVVEVYFWVIIRYRGGKELPKFVRTEPSSLGIRGEVSEERGREGRSILFRRCVVQL